MQERSRLIEEGIIAPDSIIQTLGAWEQNGNKVRDDQINQPVAIIQIYKCINGTKMISVPARFYSTEQIE